MIKIDETVRLREKKFTGKQILTALKRMTGDSYWENFLRSSNGALTYQAGKFELEGRSNFTLQVKKVSEAWANEITTTETYDGIRLWYSEYSCKDPEGTVAEIANSANQLAAELFQV